MDANDLKGLYVEATKRMRTALEHAQHELAGVRTGRASVTILDAVHVEAYGSRMPLNQLGGLSVPEPALIVARRSEAAGALSAELGRRFGGHGLESIPVEPLA